MQGGFNALKLGAQRGRFLLGTLQRLAALLQLHLEALTSLDDDRLGLLVQAPGEPADEILQCIADCDFGAKALPFLFLQLFQIAVDRGLGAGVAQRHSHGVHRRVLALRPQRIAGLLDVALVQAAACHRALRLFRNVLHTT